MEFQVFMRDTEQTNNWVTKQEVRAGRMGVEDRGSTLSPLFPWPSPGPQAVLAMEDIGDSLDTTEALLKKQEDFEKTMAAQEEKFKVTGGGGGGL